MTELEILLEFAGRGVVESAVSIVLFLSSSTAIGIVCWALIRALESFLAYRVELRMLDDEKRGEFPDETD